MFARDAKLILCIAATAGAIALGVASAGPAATERAVAGAAQADQEQKTLYERLGGLQPISVVVSDFLDVLVPDPELNENPAIDAARKRVPTEYLKYHVTAMVCQATGGPCEYKGRAMAESHAHLHISEREWDRMLELFKGVLEDHNVPERETQELVAIVESTKGDIVTVTADDDRSLYERLGGLPAISVVVSDFIDVLVPDPMLNRNPAIDAARKRVPAEYLKYQVTAMVCQATGGPCEYSGRNMTESHAHLNITEDEWDRMVELFVGVLEDHDVPEREQQELLQVLGSTKDQIVSDAG